MNAAVAPVIRAGVANPLPIGAGAVVLETTGRRTGLPRPVPVLSTRFGRTITVSTVRSDSQWLRNIEADPKVAVWVGGRRRDAAATVARGPLNRVRLEVEAA